MVTKWRNFTARTVVKLVSFLLIIVLAFLMLNRIYSSIYRTDSERILPDIVFSNLSDYRVFYDYHMNSAYYYAATIAQYKSEEPILAGEYIRWTMNASEHWYGDEVSYEHRLENALNGSTYQWVEDSDYKNLETRESAEQYAISQQLNDFRMARNALEGRYGDMYNTQGVVYYIKSDGFLYYNVAPDRQNAEYFKTQPVYIVTNDLGIAETSHANPYNPYNAIDTGMPIESDTVIYVAFERGVADAKTAEYSVLKSLFIRDFTIIAVSAILILALLTVLFSGAGRRQADSGEAVHFTVLDKPYLDLGLAAVICWIVFMILLIVELSYNITNYNNTKAMNLLLAAAAVVTIPPALWWLTSFAKRMKAPRFWRHTLIFAVLYGIVRFIRSLWAGFPLTAKAGAVAAASCCCLIYMAAVGAAINFSGGFFAVFSVVLLTAVITFLLLRYARRIHLLELGARAASLGAYDCKISVGKGELGSIADSINNISDGINTAVEQRMKSERLKTELITNVSHDIRTPLTSIITYTDLLKHEGLQCEKAPEYLDVLIQKSQRLKTLTDELFEASKAATGNIDVSIAELDLVSLINQVLGELDGSISASGLDLRVKLPERALVNADGKLMWRVMENLLSNVFKYSLKNSRVYLSAERENDWIRVDIKNISATELNVEPSELIERFKRGDEARADGGSGLGLSIVQSFLTAQGGRLSLSIDGDLFKASVYLPAL